MSSELNRREFLRTSGAALAAGGLMNQAAIGAAAQTEPSAGAAPQAGPQQQTTPRGGRPNVVYFHVDNLGTGRSAATGAGCCGAPTRGASTGSPRRGSSC